MVNSSHTVLGCLRSYLTRQRCEEGSDGELLQRFAAGREDDGFTGLLQRHGPMVLRLARRVVGDWQVAEDVFQATFLTLARKAHTIRRPESLPCWLHGVAFRLALRARRSRLRRQERERHVHRPHPPAPLEELTALEFLAVLDEELQGLPETYRGPLILCCLEGLPQDEAAKRLGCSAGAVKGRLERGRHQLRLRLAKRGLTLPAAFAGLLVAGSAGALSPALVQATLAAARPGASATPAAASLARAAMRTTFLNKLKALCAAVVLVVAGSGLGMVMMRQPAAKDGEPPAPSSAGVPAERGVDIHGDPLPEDAVMRLGTIRRRAVGAQLAVSADGKSIISVRVGKYLRVWDASTGALRRTQELPSECRGLSALSPHGRWLVTDGVPDGTLTVWDVRTGKAARTLAVKGVHQFAPVAFSPDGRRLAALGHVGNERSIRVWDLDTGREVWEKHVRTNLWSHQLAFTPDGKRLLVSFSSQGMSCWDLVTGRLLWQNKGFEPSLMVLTPDGKILSDMQRAKNPVPALDVATGRPVRLENAPPLTADVSRLTLSPDGRTLLLSTARGVTVWDVVDGKERRTLTGAGEEVVFAPDGKTLVSNDGSLQRWELATGKPLYPDTFAQGHVGEVLALRFSADGRRLASASADGSVRLWDTTTGRPLHVWRGHEARRPAWGRHETGARALDITPDGRWVLSAGSLREERIKLWDASTGREARSITLPGPERGERERRIFDLRISPDGARASGLFGARFFDAAVGASPPKVTYKLATWDLKTGKLLACRPVEASFTAISPDGQTLLSNRGLMDVASGKEVARLEGARGNLPCVFSPDGALVVGSFEETARKGRVVRASSGVRLWETATGKLVAELKTNSWGGQVASHPDSRLVATNDLLGIRVWDVLTGKVVARFNMPEQVRSSITRGSEDTFVSFIYAGCLTFTPDGRRLATGHPDSTILVWDVPARGGRPEPPAAKELESLWADLAGPDAAKAWRAVWRMTEVPNDAMSLLRGRLQPHPVAPADVTQKLLAALDDRSFERRKEAVKRLQELGLRAEPSLRAALQAKPSLEQKRRIEALLTALAETPPLSAEELRQLRGVVVLERMRSPAARRLLEELTKGPDSARLTRQARAALARMR